MLRIGRKGISRSLPAPQQRLEGQLTLDVVLLFGQQARIAQAIVGPISNIMGL
jgi:hypothetical protein